MDPSVLSCVDGCRRRKDFQNLSGKERVEERDDKSVEEEGEERDEDEGK